MKTPGDVLVISKTDDLHAWCKSTFPQLNLLPMKTVFELQQGDGASVKFNGAIIDLSLRLHASQEEHLYIRALEDIYPVIFAAQLEEEHPILWMDGSCGDTVHDFQQRLVSQPKRSLRRSRRHSLSLSVEISDSLDFKTISQASTVNISESGVFVTSCENNVESGSVVYCRFPSLDASQIAQLYVCWSIPWGQTLHTPPGFGAKFAKLPNQLQDLLFAILRKNSVSSETEEADL